MVSIDSSKLHEVRRLGLRHDDSFLLLALGLLKLGLLLVADLPGYSTILAVIDPVLFFAQAGVPVSGLIFPVDVVGTVDRAEEVQGLGRSRKKYMLPDKSVPGGRYVNAIVLREILSVVVPILSNNTNVRMLYQLIETIKYLGFFRDRKIVIPVDSGGH